MKNTFATIKFWMDKILSIACAILLSFMTILVLIQVFTRFVLNNPVAFTEELVRYSLIWTGFIGAAYAFSTREHILYDNCPDFSGFNVRKHGLKTGSLKVRTRITVVRVPAQIGKAVLLCIGFKNTLLVGNGIALALQLVLMGKSWVKGGNWLLVGLS